MIVRILGEGQRDVPDEQVDALNGLDEELQAGLDSSDEPRFRTALNSLLDAVRGMGEAVPDDMLVPSDLVLPGPDASMDDVRALLGEEGLIPG